MTGFNDVGIRGPSAAAPEGQSHARHSGVRQGREATHKARKQGSGRWRLRGGASGGLVDEDLVVTEAAHDGYFGLRC